MSWWWWIPIGLAGLFVLDRLLLVAEERGWIYYRRIRPNRATIGAAFLSVNAIFEPNKAEQLKPRTEQQQKRTDDEPR
jgi:hypothetical protein